MESLGSCGTPEGDIPSQVFLSILAFINLTALIFANVEAYKARHINTEYSESLYVGYAMVTLLQTVVIGAPLILIPTDPQTGFLIHTILLIVSSASVLFLIFVPKLHFYYLDLRERGKMEETGLDCHIDVIEEQEEKEEEEEQNRGIRIVHVDSMVETQNTQQPNQYGLRIVRRQYIPQSRPSRNAEATVPKRKQRPKKVYDNTAPAAEVANFAMMAM
jgi:competence protein ComGC